MNRGEFKLTRVVGKDMYSVINHKGETVGYITGMGFSAMVVPYKCPTCGGAKYASESADKLGPSKEVKLCPTCSSR